MKNPIAHSLSLTWLAGLITLGSFGLLMLFLAGYRAPVYLPNLQAFTEAAFYLGTFFLVRQLLAGLGSFHVAEHLLRLSVLGLITLALLLLPAVFLPREAATAAPSRWLLIMEGLQSAFLVFYFTAGAVAGYQIIGRQGSARSRKALMLLSSCLVALPLLQAWGLDIPLLNYALFATAGAAGLSLLFRVDWLVSLDSKLRKSTLFYLLALSFLSGILLLKTFFPELHYELPIHTAESHYVVLTGFLTLGFSLISALFLLFHLPVAAILDIRDAEKKHLIEAGLEAEKTHDLHTLLATLARQTRSSSSASAAWVTRVNNENPENGYPIVEGISLNDIKRIDYSLHAHPGHFQLDRAKDFLFVRDLEKDPVLGNHVLSIRSLAIYPFSLQDGSEWRLCLGFEVPNGLNEHLAREVSHFVGHTRLSASHVCTLQEVAAKARLEKDISIGREMQKRLLPKAFPLSKKADIAADGISAEEIGGDYYDCHVMKDQSIAVLMADVSGKGTPAALHVAEMKGIFQSLMLSDPEPEEFLSLANRAVNRCFDKGMFITVLYAVIDLEKLELRYARGGHCPLIHYNAKEHKIHTLQDDGLGLGIINGESFDKTLMSRKVKLHAGDIIVLYTDGIVESRTHDAFEEFGYERLRDCIYLNMELDSKSLNKKILREVQSFSGSSIRDDMSLMTIKIKANGQNKNHN